MEQADDLVWVLKYSHKAGRILPLLFLQVDRFSFTFACNLKMAKYKHTIFTFHYFHIHPYFLFYTC